MTENPTDACETCELLKALETEGRESRDPSVEVDARVRFRRHVRDAHQREIPLSM
ncbi:hypothetical protein ACH4OW_21905 [Streptomyces sp. NPDC017056]|uniref:hypothetical protein n=1 Tax=Streptomyces sp. NPDC017056 TaxID=3364973 RepID=UPI003790045A